MRSTFLGEETTKQVLTDFLNSAKQLSMGPKVAEFERSFATWQGRQYCTMVNSGSSANLVLLQALLNLGRLQKGDRVGVSAVTWATNVMPVIQLGLVPVLVDVELDTLNVSVNTLSSVPDLKCLFITHLLGFSDNVDAISRYCADKNILLLEDTCESLGASYGPRRLGNFGVAATFSTFVGHHMSTIEGGLVVTDDRELAEMIVMVRAHGWDRNLPTDTQTNLRTAWNITSFEAPYTFYTLGYNVRPTELQGVIGLEQMKYIDDANERRRKSYGAFYQAVPGVSPCIDTCAFAIPILCASPQQRDRYIAKCQDKGIEVRPIVAGNMARQPFFQPYNDGRSFPNADKIHTSGFYMPNHPDLTMEEQQRLVSVFIEQPKRHALITGITGQDGSYLADFLLEKGYRVFGLVRHTTYPLETSRIKHLLKHPNLTLVTGDMTDASSLQQAVQRLAECPGILEIYNLAAQSFVKASFDIPELTTQQNSVGVLKLLDVVRLSPARDRIRLYQASSSEMYGKVLEVPQTEETPFYPRSPYGVSKVYSYWICKNYRESYGLFISNGILFNHESPRRGELFVTRKISQGVARIAKGSSEPIVLGNLNAQRDWGHAKDFVKAMWLILQHEQPDDWVISSGVTHSVRAFVEEALRVVNIPITWKGEGLHEVGVDSSGRVLVSVSADFYRPAEVDLLLGDSTKAKTRLGWTSSYSFEALVQDMVSHDLAIQS